MKSTSCKEIARETLERCLEGRPPKELPAVLTQDACGDALFGVLVEGLADRFEPALCDAYARLFSQAIAMAEPGIDAGALLARYDRIRRPRTAPARSSPRQVIVLSRVTLGADVAVTSVLLAAAKRKYPHAKLVFAGPRKNYELFAGDPHVHHAEVPYGRGGIRERLVARESLRQLAAEPDSIVIDPDSRLTQLGLLPVCDDEHYYLFESRAYGRDGSESLSQLAARWAEETFGIRGMKPYLALQNAVRRGKHIAVSLGVGENLAKRVPDPFEEGLLKLLAGTGATLSIDRGAGGEEAARVAAAVERSGAKATLWEGSFAGFARIIASSALYVGYDSAGQHVAAAADTPLICVFGGFPAARMFDRWRPTGQRCTVIRVEKEGPSEVLAQVEKALAERR